MTIVETLRGRVLSGLHAGTLEAGDRVQSARELVAEFDVDHRLILAAYRQLADEGLVDIRERGGVYVAATNNSGETIPTLPVKWFVDTFAEAFARGIPAPELSEWLRRSVETLRLRAVAVSSTEDQAAGLARELRDDFGLAADGVTGSALTKPSQYPTVVKRADVLITTQADADRVRPVAAALGKPVLTIAVRPELVSGDWVMLLRRRVWAIVATPERGEILREFFAGVRGGENLSILVHGRDDLSAIPDGAPTYVTAGARRALGDLPIRGRVLPTERTIALDSARDVFDYIVRANLRVIEVVHPPTTDAAVRRA